MFEYNDIDPRGVGSVELIAPDASAYTAYKRDLYDDSDEIPEERRRMADSDRTGVFEDVLGTLLRRTDELDAILETIVELNAAIPAYVKNDDEVRASICLDGYNSDVDVEYGDTQPDTRADCRHSKNDEYRDGDDKLCCFRCRPEGQRKPAKFDADDDPCSMCSSDTPNPWKLKKALIDELAFSTTGGEAWLAEHFESSDLDVHDVQSRFNRAKDDRSPKVQLAFRAAFPDEDYYYQRAEALLRDIDSAHAEDSGPGAGGRTFEYEAIQQLAERFELRDETVFEVTFDPDAPPVTYPGWVDDPDEVAYKEADAIIEGDIGPIVVDLFTQRSHDEKRRQVQNYAELYEIATGDEPDAWGITDDTHAELLELDTLVGSEPTDGDEGQASLADFIK